MALPSLHASFIISLSRCAALGSSPTKGSSIIIRSLFFIAARAGIGFLLAMVLFSGMRMKLEGNEAIPKAFQGVPITLVSAAFLSLAFMGFGGLV